MNKNYAHLASLVFNQPHLCSPDYAETILAVLSDKLNLSEGMFSVKGDEKEQRDSKVNANGTYILPIVGSMVHRGSSLDAASGINSYQKIKEDISSAIDNPNVKNILLDIDSPGGSVAGAFDLADFIKEAAGSKPIYALARDTMASAGYLIASGATKVYATQTARVGSIGVVAMHVDQSEANKARGIKPTIIKAGELKDAGNPHEPLKGEALGYLQESVNDSYEMFVNTVAKNRGMDVQEIRDTEARVYRGQKAADIGLVDGVRTFEEVLSELATNSQERVNIVKPNIQGMKMENEENQELEAAVETLTADLNKATKGFEALKASVIAEGYRITAEGIEKEAEAEMIEVAGVLTDKASLPEHVVKALEEAESAKVDASLTEQAKEMLPNFDLSEAKVILSAMSGMGEEARESLESALKMADKAYAGLMEEKGERGDTEMSSPSDALSAKIEETMAKDGLSRQAATAKVVGTDEGMKLYKEAMKENK